MYICKRFKIMAKFHELQIKEVKKELEDTVSIVFSIPEELKSNFAYKAGQYLTIEHTIQGENLRRSYSLCSSPETDSDWRIAVKQVEGGRMSGFLCNVAKAGDKLKISEPEGSFTIEHNTNTARSYVFFAAGSGITPIISLIKSTLVLEKNSLCTLFFANRNEDLVLFDNELKALLREHPNRFKAVYLFSKPINVNLFTDEEKGYLTGRLDPKKTLTLLRLHVDLSVDPVFYMCGPEGFMKAVEGALESVRVENSRIVREYFTTPDAQVETLEAANGENCNLTLKLDGETHSLKVQSGTTILDAALSMGIDAPYSCRGAVCSSCIAKVEEGKVEMRMNYTLTDKEVGEGYILTCQSLCKSNKVLVDYDA